LWGSTAAGRVAARSLQAVNPMRTRRQATIQDLRLAIRCLPRDTRIAMLDGIRDNNIIVGAYSDRNGICPMLAAHRAGGRTSLISFARAWDRFAFRNVGRGLARRATARELLVLTSHLEASLLEDDGPALDLGAAILEHRALVAGRPPADRAGAATRPGDADRAGDPDRATELRSRPGWAWLRVMRRYDEYQRALVRLDSEAAEAEPARPGNELQPVR
jgi:hypothetical protein